MVPACSVKVPRVSTYSGYRLVNRPFAYGAFTLSGWLSQNHSAKTLESIVRSEPRDARIPVWALPVSLAATSGITCCFLFLRLLRCFSSPGYPPVGWYDMTRTGLPHSEMYGSLPACGSPYLFAAYRVLHRLSMPRHPPYALCSLITFRNFTFKVNHTMIMLSVFVKVCYPKMSFLPH